MRIQYIATILISLASLQSLRAEQSAPFGDQTFKFNFTIQSWNRICTESNANSVLNCGIPLKLYSPIEIQSSVNFPGNEGEVQAKSFDFESPKGSAEKLQGVIRLFATYPHANLKQSKYIQLQLELIQPVRAFCIQTVRLKNPMMFSPTSCTAIESVSENLLNPQSQKTFKQIGFNLIQLHN